jgi:hypothetical protein
MLMVFMDWMEWQPIEHRRLPKFLSEAHVSAGEVMKLESGLTGAFVCALTNPASGANRRAIARAETVFSVVPFNGEFSFATCG